VQSSYQIYNLDKAILFSIKNNIQLGKSRKLFETRTHDAEVMTNLVKDGIFNSIAEYVNLVPLGYETHITDEVRELLRFVQNETSAYIKFAPDYFVVDNSNPENLYLLEFKCTRTPLYSPRRINMLRLRASDFSLEAEAIGQMEQAPFENYLRLNQMRIRVAILNYCAYADQMLLCELVEKLKVIHRDVVRTATFRGSRTPFVNVDLRSMRSLANFLCEEHPRLNLGIIEERVANTIVRLRESLPVIHADV
jgi:hypothetical protein